MLSDKINARFLTVPTKILWPFTERKEQTSTRQNYLGPSILQKNSMYFLTRCSKGGIYCPSFAIFAPDEICGVTFGKVV